jgi:hypothetical protein
VASAIIEKAYSVDFSDGECFGLVQEALQQLGLKKMRIKEEIFPRYLLMEYKFALLEKAQIQVKLKGKQDSSVVSLKWCYPVSTEKEMRSVTNNNRLIRAAEADREERRKTVERLLEEFKCRIGAVEIAPDFEKKNHEKEVIREK